MRPVFGLDLAHIVPAYLAANQRLRNFCTLHARAMRARETTKIPGARTLVGKRDEPIAGDPLPHWKAPPRFYKGSTPTFGERSKARLAKPYSTQIVIPIFN